VRDNLEVKEVLADEGSAQRRFVVVRNPEQVEHDRAVRDRLLARLEAAIEHVNRSRKGHTKARCVLKGHRGYGRYVRELRNGKLRIDQAHVKADTRLDGKYLISTTDPTLSAKDVAMGYKQLLEVERAFRTLKTTLELRPLHHRLPQRIKAHVLLCWLALLLVRLTETESGMTWDGIREAMEDLSLVKLGTKDGPVEMLTDSIDEQRNIMKKARCYAATPGQKLLPNRPKPVATTRETALSEASDNRRVLSCVFLRLSNVGFGWPRSGHHSFFGPGRGNSDGLVMVD
jgi:hypothetical protein